MDGLNQTILQLTEKNRRIQSRLRGQGIQLDEEEVQGAGSSKKSLGNVTRLSYGTWAGAKFLSSTILSTSMADFETDEKVPKSTGKKKKTKKKTKLKVHTEVSFSSEEEDLAAGSKGVNKGKPKTLRSDGATNREALGKITDNIQPYSSEKRTPKIPAMATEKTKSVPKEKQRNAKHTLNPATSGPNSLTPSCKASGGLGVKTAKPALTSGLERIKLLWDRNHETPSVESEGSVCPDSSTSSQAYSESLSSSQTSQSLLKKKSKGKKTPAKKKSSKPSMFQDLVFSSESETEIERNKDKLEEFMAQSKLHSVLAPSDKSKTNNVVAEASSVNIKNFVMDSDSESDEKERQSQRSVEDVVIPCTQDVDMENSEGSVDEAYVTIPCSQDVVAPHKKALVPDTLTENMEMDVKENNSSVVLPESMSVQHHSPDLPQVEEDNIVLVKATETQLQDLSEVDDSDICVIPCSQDENTSPDVQNQEENHTQGNGTPSLVTKLFRAVSSAISGSRETTPNTKNSSCKPPKSVQHSEVTKKPKLTTSTRKNIFEAIQFSSDEDDGKENQSVHISGITPMSFSSDNTSSLPNLKFDFQSLSQRLQNVRMSAKKKEMKKLTTKKKKGSSTRSTKGSSSGESSHSPSFDSSKGSVFVADSEPSLSHKSYTDDSISVVEESQPSPKVLVKDSESFSIELDDCPDLTVPDSQATNLGLQMSVSGSSPVSFTPSIGDTVRYIPPDKNTGSGSQKEENKSDGGDHSVQMSLYRNLSNSQTPDSEESPEKVNMSIQVSMMGSTEDEDELDDAGMNEQQEMCVQVSMLSIGRSSQDNDSPNALEAAYVHGDTKFFTPPENKTINVTLEASSNPSPSPQMASFCTQVSIPSSQGDSNVENERERVSFNGLDYSEKSMEISLEIDVARNLRDELGNSKDAREDEVIGEIDLENGAEYDSGGESGDGDDIQAGVGPNMSLQVSMCVDAVMEDSDEPPDNETDPPSQHQVSLQVSLQASDEDSPIPASRNKNRRRLVSDDSSEESNREIIDDSDADPDFEVSVRKAPKAPSTTKSTTRKPRSRGSNKSNKSDSSDKNYTEAQAIKTVLLCEKKESVKGFDPETDEDDYELPDIAPPKEVSVEVLDESSDDNFDNFLQEMRNKRKEKEKRILASQRNIDDFVVDDDDVTSSEEEDNECLHSRINAELEKTRNKRIPSDGSDSVFKTPGKTPGRFKTNTALPSTSGITGKQVSKTPAPARVQQLHSNSHFSSNSTGHLPVFHGFLKSLSSDLDDKQRHPEARRFVKDFKKVKEELTSKLFKLYNDTILDKQLPSDLNICWNSRLTTTAGFCAYKRDRTTASGRTCRIELSVKVCDSAERVRDTLVHELCHAAVWLIYGKNDGHGSFWQTLAKKAMRIHPDLPSISRCHMYDIHHKFIYKCTKCGQQIGRHTKSLNVEKKVCGICHGKFEVMINTPKGLTPQAARTPRTPNKFALFVKDNYNAIKQKNTGFKHAEIMKALSAEFGAKTKVS